MNRTFRGMKSRDADPGSARLLMRPDASRPYIRIRRQDCCSLAIPVYPNGEPKETIATSLPAWALHLILAAMAERASGVARECSLIRDLTETQTITLLMLRLSALL